eukprot:jgi/Chlat1/5851/Chrsp4S00494
MAMRSLPLTACPVLQQHASSVKPCNSTAALNEQQKPLKLRGKSSCKSSKQSVVVCNAADRPRARSRRAEARARTAFAEKEEAELSSTATAEAVQDVVDYDQPSTSMPERILALLELAKAGQVSTPLSPEQLTSVFPFPLDKFQLKAIDVLHRGKSVVVSAPTSSGKTVIAEAAAVDALACGQKMIYTTPLKALSNQKLRDFRLLFGEKNVGLLTGDAAVNKDAPLVIMTTEILRNMLYTSAGGESADERLKDVSVIVLDEVHYLSDVDRGTVWEVPHIENVLAQLRENQMLPAIYVIFSRRGCDEAVNYAFEYDTLVSTAEIEEITQAVEELRSRAPETLRSEEHVAALCKGIAAHHAGCLPAWKVLIEELFQRGLLKVVFATETLAAGINMPARAVCISTLSKRTNEGHALLGSNTLLQIAGRAGRRGLDSVGHAVRDMYETANLALQTANVFYKLLVLQIIVQSPFEGAEEAAKILLSGPEPLKSQFTVSYGMALNLLKGRSLKDAQRIVEKSFGNYVGSEGQQRLLRKLKSLEAEAARLLDVNVELGQTPEEIPAEDWEDYVRLKSKRKAETRALRRLKHQYLSQRARKVAAALASFHPAADASSMPLVTLRLGDTSSGAFEELPAFLVDIEVLDVDQSLYGSWRPSKRNHLLDEEDDDGSDGEEAGGNGTLARGHSDADEDDDEADEDEDDDGDALTTDNQDEEEAMPAIAAQYLCLGANNQWYRVSSGHIGHVAANDFTKQPQFQEAVSLISRRKPTIRQPWSEVPRSGMGGALDLALQLKGSELTADLVDDLPTADELMVHAVESGLNIDDDNLKALEAEIEEVRTRASEAKRAMRSCPAYWPLKKAVKKTKIRSSQGSRLLAKAERLRTRLGSVNKSGWNEFMQLVEVLLAAKALVEVNVQAPNTTVKQMRRQFRLTDLGEVAAELRGSNELWLAVALTSPALSQLTPQHLAAVAAALVTDEAVGRLNLKCNYEPSEAVMSAVGLLQPRRMYIRNLQARLSNQIPVEVDTRLAALVEAWAAGATWQQVMNDANLDDGDAARLLRRVADLLAQITHITQLPTTLRRSARQAATLMDRSPISELL